jgi:hypothetical protein
VAGNSGRVPRPAAGSAARAALTVATNIVDRPYYQAARASKAALDSLEPALLTPALNRLNNQEARWTKSASNMLVLCEPT